MGQNSSCSDSNGQWTSQQGEPAQVNGVEPFAQPTDSADLQGSSEAKDLSPNTTEIPPTGIDDDAEDDEEGDYVPRGPPNPPVSGCKPNGQPKGQTNGQTKPNR